MSYVHLYDQIERYANGELAGEELQQFEESLRQDSALAEEVELHRALHLALKDQDFSDFRSTLAVVSQEYSTSPIAEKKKVVRSLNWWMLAAAAAIIAFALFFWLMPHNSKLLDSPVAKTDPKPPVQEKSEKSDPKKQPTQESPYVKVEEQRKQNKQAKPPQQQPKLPELNTSPLDLNEAYVVVAEDLFAAYNPTTLRGETTPEATPHPLEQAIVASERKNWKKVIQLLLLTDSSKEGNDPLKLRANAYFQVKQFDKAAKDYTVLASDVESTYKYVAEWNLLLCYLVQLPREQMKFEQQLSNILDPEREHPYRKQALELQQLLK